MTSTICRGVWPAVATPVNPDLTVDDGRFLAHCRRLLEDGASGLGLLGTTGEANSLSTAERMRALETAVEGGIPGDRLMPGTGCCALADTISLTRHAVEHGCAGVLLLPPFYYKGVPEEGLYTVVSRVIDAVADRRLRIYLYHIPQMSGVPWSLGLVERLVRDYPETVVGLKDSSGQWDNLEALLGALPGFAVFPGSETFMLPALRLGAAGCISATANVNAAAIRRLHDHWRDADADAMHEAVVGVRRIIEGYPLIPAVKGLLAERYNDPEWARPLPPIEALDSTRHRELTRRLEGLWPHAGMAPAAAE